MSIDRKPGKVQGARVAGNSEALSIMGKHGAEARNAKLAQEAHARKLAEEHAEREEWDRMRSANEHIIPPPSPYGD